MGDAALVAKHRAASARVVPVNRVTAVDPIGDIVAGGRVDADGALGSRSLGSSFRRGTGQQFEADEPRRGADLGAKRWQDLGPTDELDGRRRGVGRPLARRRDGRVVRDGGRHQNGVDRFRQDVV